MIPSSKSLVTLGVLTAVLLTPGAALAKNKKGKNKDKEYTCDTTLTMKPATGAAEVYTFSLNAQSSDGLRLFYGVHIDLPDVSAIVTGTETDGQWTFTVEYDDDAHSGQTRALGGTSTGTNTATEWNAAGQYRIYVGNANTGFGGSFTMHATCTKN